MTDISVAALHPSASGNSARTRIWDLPTRIFHWTLAAAVIGMIATGLGDVMEWHFRIGYTVLALLLFRLLWGFVSGGVESLAKQWHAVWGKWIAIALVSLHVLAVLFHVLVKRHRLVKPMISGDKLLSAANGNVAASRDDAVLRWLALVLFALCAGVAYWVASLRA